MALSKTFAQIFHKNFSKNHRTLLVKYFSQDAPLFPGAKTTWTENLQFTTQDTPIPVYRVMDRNGKILNSNDEPQLEKPFLQKMYKDMSFLNVMDKILYESQRQGRISFYMTNYGEEATHIGSAAALNLNDVVYGQYREVGVLIWRGFTLKELFSQCYGNVDDEGKGRQMPVHYGSKTLNFVTISSPLATQIPQAAGAAFALKNQNRVVICYFGEGAASEGDTHAALNFAATLECPVIFFCRNNGYAISTHAKEQYKGDGIAGRGPGYGMHTLRVDGNDVLAVFNATKLAKEFALKNSKPVLIEALTYRVGHHSTSDDSTAYRSTDEIDQWTTHDYPTTKFKAYLKDKGYWSDEMDEQYLKEARKNVLSEFSKAEKRPKPAWTEMFKDVYRDMPPHIREQQEYMVKHVEKHKQDYPIQQFSQ